MKIKYSTVNFYSIFLHKKYFLKFSSERMYNFIFISSLSEITNSGTPISTHFLQTNQPGENLSQKVSIQYLS